MSMSSDGAVLRDQKVDLLTPFLVHRPAVPSPRKPRPRSAIDLQMRLPAFLRVSDWFGICVIGVLTDLALAQYSLSQSSHKLAIVLGATLMVNYLHIVRGYCVRGMRRVTAQMAKTSLAWIAVLISLGAIDYVADRFQAFPNPWAGIWFGSTLLFLCATRLVVGLLLARWQRDGRLAPNIAVFGSGPEAVALARRLHAQSEDANVVGVFIDGDASVCTDDIAGDSDLLASLVGSGQVDEVILALPPGSPMALRRALAKFEATQVEVKIDPGFAEAGVAMRGFSPVAGIPTLTVQERPLAGWGAPFKRAEDIVLTSVLLVVLAPLLLLIALLIKLDSRGPVIFRQERLGFDNSRVLVLKFRTMQHDPNPDPSVPQARRNDPRITRFGAFLRRTSLDELPQLFNVLRGDMSLVGPRPHATAHNEKYAQLISGFLARHRMKPGITGWAQVNGWRGETDTIEKMQGRLEHDLYYIANWSLLLDIKVLLMTIPVTIRGTNAH
jgi:Undecaprenyl-phosphate glucose phosphotransferase